MIIALVILLILVCYFILFTLSRHDFVLIRKDISVVRIFDYSFFYILSGYFFARLFYIIEHSELSLARPLVFLHVFKYPGLSILGFFLGGAVIIYILLWKKKIVSRVIDVFYLASFPCFIFTIVMLSQPILLYVRVAVGFIAFLLLLFLAKQYREYHLKDGSAALLILITLSSYYVVSDFLIHEPSIILNLSLSQIMNAIVFILASIVLLRKEKII